MSSLLDQKREELEKALEIARVKLGAIYDNKNPYAYKSHPDYPDYLSHQEATKKIRDELMDMVSKCKIEIKCKCPNGDVAAEMVKNLRGVIIIKESKWRRVKRTYGNPYTSLSIYGYIKNEYTEGMQDED